MQPAPSTGIAGMRAPITPSTSTSAGARAAPSGSAGVRSSTSAAGMPAAGSGGMAPLSTSGAGAAAMGGRAGMSSGACEFPDPPSDVSAWVDESWKAQLGDNINKRKAWLLDNVMLNKGSLNLCVRWGATSMMPDSVRMNLAATTERWFNDWFKFVHWDHGFSGCTGGDAAHSDYWLWFDDQLPGNGGAAAVGGDWGLRMPVSTFLNAFSQPSFHITEHEMGHGFGIPDYYDWTGSKPKGGSIMIVGSTPSEPPTSADIWLLKRT